MRRVHRSDKAALILIGALLWGSLGWAPNPARSAEPGAPNFLYFPFFDANTTLYVQNAGATTENFEIQVLSNPTASISRSIAGLGTLKLTATDFSGLAPGEHAVIVSGPGPLQGTAFVQQAGGSADRLGVYRGWTQADAAASQADFGIFYNNLSGIISRLVLFTPGNVDPQTVTLTAYDLNGTAKGTSPYTLNFNPKEVKSISGTEIGFAGGEQGWVQVASGGSLVGVMLQSGTGLFRAVDPAQAGGFAPRLYKSYDDGSGARTSKLLLFNPTGGQLTASVYYRDGANQIIDPHGTYTLSGHALEVIDLASVGNLNAGKAYAATVATAPSMGEESRFDGTAYSSGAFRVELGEGGGPVPAILRTMTTRTTFSIQNAGSAATTVALEYRNADGAVQYAPAGTGTTLGIGQSLRVDTAGISALGTAFEGSVKITSAQPVSVLVDEYVGPAKVYLPVVLSDSASCIPKAYLNEPYYYDWQWNMPFIHANTAWDNCIRGSPGVTVAVVDTGIDLTHPDLVTNLLPGINLVEYRSVNGTQVYDQLPADDQGHGTHVSGIIGASLNRAGVIGVAPKVNILPVRVMYRDPTGEASGTYLALADGIVRAAQQAQIINLSIGGKDDSQTLCDTINAVLNDNKHLIIAAAGNYRAYGNTRIYPAACADQNGYLYPRIIGVASVDSTYRYSEFSNYGQYVDIAAPGEAIFSTYPFQGQFCDQHGTAISRYTCMSGTSMAAPHVSGLAALIWSQHPEYTADQVIAAIESTALDLGILGRDSDYGWGLIQVDAALGLTAGSVSAPQSGESAPDRTETTATATGEDRGAPIASGRVLVKMKPGELIAALGRHSAALGTLSVTDEIAGIGTLVLDVPAGQEWAVVDQLRGMAEVEYAEPDYILTIQ